MALNDNKSSSPKTFNLLLFFTLPLLKNSFPWNTRNKFIGCSCFASSSKRMILFTDSFFSPDSFFFKHRDSGVNLTLFIYILLTLIHYTPTSLIPPNFFSYLSTTSIVIFPLLSCFSSRILHLSECSDSSNAPRRAVKYRHTNFFF